MAKVVYAEESLLNYLKTLTDINQNVVGLIIGQVPTFAYIICFMRSTYGCTY